MYTILLGEKKKKHHLNSNLYLLSVVWTPTTFHLITTKDIIKGSLLALFKVSQNI
jgi:hypothetical protein